MTVDNCNKRIERVGTTCISNEGYIMTCTEYYTNKNIAVTFENGYSKQVAWSEFINGKVKTPYHRSVEGVGFKGSGHYSAVDENGNKTKAYNSWHGMFLRCYNKKYQEKRPTYIGASVDSSWHNFQEFNKWFDTNYYEVEGCRMELDKDIIVKGNKIYSPATCIFVPSVINSCFVKSNSIRGDLPIGVQRTDRTKGFISFIVTRGTRKNLGRFHTPEEAFQAYKTAKEEYIKEIANEYKDKIPDKLYQALLNYQVEITD